MRIVVASLIPHIVVWVGVFLVIVPPLPQPKPYVFVHSVLDPEKDCIDARNK